MPVPVFRARVREGRIEWSEQDAARRREWLRRLSGREVEVIVRPPSRKRSNDQNAWLWGVAYPLLAETFGYERHEHALLHYGLLGECFGTVYDQRFGRALVRVGSSQMTTKEFSDYMEWLVRWAAVEHDCRIPLPGESA